MKKSSENDNFIHIYVKAVHDNYFELIGYSQNQRDMLNWKYLLDSRPHKNTFSAKQTTLEEEECASSAAGMLIAMIADKVIICYLTMLASRLPPSLFIDN